MLSAAIALLLLADGGGTYTTVFDYEWPIPSISTPYPAMGVGHNTQAQGDYGTIGAASLPNWDGGMLVDAQGLRTVRGPTNVFYYFDPANEGWPNPDGGGRYEVCHTPGADVAVDWVAGYDPTWNGSVYLFDASDGSQHTAIFVFGYSDPGVLLVRLAAGGNYTNLTPYVPTPIGQTYCTSVEWNPLGSGRCDIWVRHDGCGFVPAVLCRASTIIAYDTSGNGYCPAPPGAVHLGNRYSETAPTSTHINALRVGRK